MVDGAQNWPYFFDRITAGLDADGMPVAWHHRITGSSIFARWAPPVFKNGFDSDTIDVAEPPYDLPNMLRTTSNTSRQASQQHSGAVSVRRTTSRGGKLYRRARGGSQKRPRGDRLGLLKDS